MSKEITQRWLALAASVSLLFCACQTMTPNGQAGNQPRQQPAPRPDLSQTIPAAPVVPAGVMSPAGNQIAMASHTAPAAPPCETCRPPDAAHPGSGNRLPGGPPSLPSTVVSTPYPPVVAKNEIVCNGGDRETKVEVRSDWSVYGLHTGDAVAHYDTIDGQTLVEPTNDVCLYAPRFGAVRKVSGVILHEQHQRSAGVELPTRIVQQEETRVATSVLQPVQPNRNLGIEGANTFREHTRGAGVDNSQIAFGADGSLQPYQDFLIIRRGVFDNTEKARLANRLQAAIAWSHDTALQVTLDGKPAVEASGSTSTQSVYTYELPAGKSRLRIVKIADKQNAKPGDTVDFTIRFDNVGDQTIGNVTVIDSLSRRLEYVEDSQKCSVEADFFTQPNEGESLTLRWEVIEPMQVGDGGVIRFQCRVR